MDCICVRSTLNSFGDTTLQNFDINQQTCFYMLHRHFIIKTGKWINVAPPLTPYLIPKFIKYNTDEIYPVTLTLLSLVISLTDWCLWGQQICVRSSHIWIWRTPTPRICYASLRASTCLCFKTWMTLWNILLHCLCVTFYYGSIITTNFCYCLWKDALLADVCYIVHVITGQNQNPHLVYLRTSHQWCVDIVDNIIPPFTFAAKIYCIAASTLILYHHAK